MRLVATVIPGVLVLLAFSGCFWFGGHCGPQYDDATWREPGLFAAMGTARVEATPPDPGFAFAHDWATSRWGDDLTVHHVSWTPTGAHDRGAHGPQLSLVPAPEDEQRDGRAPTVPGDHVQMMASNATTDTEWRAHLTTFLNETGTTPTDLDAWLDGFLADRTVIGRSYGGEGLEHELWSSARPIDTPPALDALADRLGEPDPDRVSTTPTGRAAFEWRTDNGTWSYRFALPVRVFDAGDLQTDASVSVRVDPADTVTGDLPQSLGNRTEVYKERLAERFAAADLPAPTFQGFDATYAIC